jgi:hypothetical protein
VKALSDNTEGVSLLWSCAILGEMENSLRKAARVTGAFAATFWAFSLVASSIGDIADGKFRLTLEVAILFFLATTAVTGVIIGWRRERAGGVIVTAAAVALAIFAYFDAGHNKLFAALISGGLFLPGGILFLLTAQQKQPS